MYYNLNVMRVVRALALGLDVSNEDPLIVLTARMCLVEQDTVPTERNIPIELDEKDLKEKIAQIPSNNGNDPSDEGN